MEWKGKRSDGKPRPKVPQQIQHFLHQSSAPLIGRMTHNFSCKTCHKRRTVYAYHCWFCNFQICEECCNQVSTDEPESKEEQNLRICHRHPLTVIENVEESEVCCEICRKPSGDRNIYGCIPCNLYLHQSCADNIPKEVHSDYHQHPLFLVTTLPYQCGACDEHCSSQLTFFCPQCSDYKLCINCFRLPTIDSGDHEKIQHFLHQHPLTFIDNEIPDEVRCEACGERRKGSNYACRRCEFFLHESCAKSPREIRSNLHPSHSLVLSKVDSQKSKCKLCYKELQIAFRCVHCNVQLGFECAWLLPSIKFQNHQHILTVLEELHEKVKCDHCLKSCLGSAVLRCLDCDFTVHLQCGPLPCTLKHKCHVDPLTLMDYVVEDDDEEFYCDACEAGRDPESCVYYCSSCPFIAHTQCVISEILTALKGKAGDVPLRCVGGPTINKNRVIGKDTPEFLLAQGSDDRGKESDCNHDKLLRLSEKDVEDFAGIVETITSEMVTHKNKNKDKGDIHEVCLYSDNAFTSLLERLDSNISSTKMNRFRNLVVHRQLVQFGDYLVPERYLYVLEDLKDKYGDVSSKSMLSPTMKSLFFAHLGRILHGMSTTKVFKITEHLLQEWWTLARLMGAAGFDIQFILKRLELVRSSYFGLEAKKFVDVSFAKQERQIKRITNKMEILKKDMQKLTEKQREVEEQRKNLETYVEHATTASMKKHLDNASKMRLRHAAEGLLPGHYFSFDFEDLAS